jgi:dUTPase
MNRDEIIKRLQEYKYSAKSLNFVDNIIEVFSAVLKEETPKFSFALIENLKNDKRFLPTRAEPKATGWDVRSASDFTVKPFQHIKIPLGFRGLCPEGWWYELKPRSSTFAKKNLHSLYGTIDQTYEGELVFACQYIPDIDFAFKSGHFAGRCATNLEIKFGDAIGQIVPVRRQEMEVVECSNEEYDNSCKERAGQRGAGGFGSTDAKGI